MRWTDIKPKLRNGETVKFRPAGNSMTPIINSGDLVTIEPVRHITEPRYEPTKGDIVVVSVGGSTYLHKITAVAQGRVQISNNKGYVNGWTSRGNIHGRLVAINGVSV